MTKKLGTLLMAALLALYLVFTLVRAVQFIQTPEPIAVVIIIALLVLPLIGGFALVRELIFGYQSERLMRRLDDEGHSDIGITLTDTGRWDKAEAQTVFPALKFEAEQNPDSWRSMARVALGYDACGDRRRARASLRQAISLERQGKKLL